MKFGNFIIFLCLVIFTTGLFSQELIKDGPFYKTTITKEFKISSGGNLEMRGISGDISVTSWNQNKVQVVENIRMEVYTEGEARKIIEHIVGQYNTSGNTLTIAGSNGRSWIKQDFKIQVPKSFNMRIQTSGGDISVDQIDGEINLNTSGGDISVDKIKGDVNVTTSGGDLSLDNITGILKGHTSGGDIDIRQLTGTGDVKTSGGSITVRHATETLKLDTSGGDIEVEDVGADLRAHTSGGSIDVVNCSGNADLNTSGGDINLRMIKGKIDAHTSGGDIEGRVFEEPLKVHTSGGDIELGDVKASISARTSGGNIEVDFIQSDFSKPHSIDLGTSGGNIQLTIPAGLPATIDAEIHLGNRRRYLPRYDIYSDFPLSKEKTEDDSGNIILRSSGDINGGGDLIKLRTSAGEIRILKSKN